MPRQVFLFERPSRFVAGTVGQPGDRTFYLQASDAAGRVVSVALEKTQVQVLADRMNELLDEIATRPGTVVPPDAEVDDLEPLAAPVDEEFRVAAMGLAWDGEAQAVVVDPASVSVGTYTETRPFVLRVNDIGGDVGALVPPKRKARRRRAADSDAVVGGGAGATA